jgi:hypothetical protein
MSSQNLTPEQQRDIELIRASEYFDAEYYLAENPRMAESGKDPARHYYLRGAKTGKDPSPAFSTKSYLERYPDVRRAGANPLVHFLKIGRSEGRSPNPLGDDIALVEESGLFDEEYYRHFRPDVPEEMSAIVHYLRHGAKEGFDPSQRFSSSSYLRMYPDVRDTGTNPLLHYLRHGRIEGRHIVEGRPLKGLFDTLYRGRWPDLTPFPVVRVRGLGPRVTVLTDSVGVSSLFGGVGTALILGVQLANAIGGSLRLATRHDPPDPAVLGPLQQANGVALLGDLETADLPNDRSVPLLMGEREILITTSWWTTRAALDSTVRREEIVYLLQEDERMFYPYGDDRLLCAETLAENGFPVVINTRRLLDHLARDYPRLGHEGLSFEPAFPGSRGGERPPKPATEKRRFFFYSRPENARNLFWRGGRAISRAIETNVLDPDVWSFHFVGRATPDVSFPRDVRPEILEGLDWRAYQSLVEDMDAALVLMDTPHPSYPPYDLAAAGAAVLTNRHPGKDDLSGISRNILVADPTDDALVDGLAAVAALGQDDEQRRRNRLGDSIARDWAETLAETVDALRAVHAPHVGAGGHVH